MLGVHGVVMPFFTCKRCNRQFEYNDNVGYSKEFCGPLCDGSDSGRRFVIRAMRDLARQLRVKANEDGNSGTDAEFAFEASASSIDRVCDEVMA